MCQQNQKERNFKLITKINSKHKRRLHFYAVLIKRKISLSVLIGKFLFLKDAVLSICPWTIRAPVVFALWITVTQTLWTVRICSITKHS